MPPVEEISSQNEAEWDAFVIAHPDANLYQNRAWRSVARDAYGLEAPFLLSRESPGAPVRGVLPLFAIDGPLQGHLTTGLFGAYGRILVQGPARLEARAELTARAERMLENRGLAYLIHKSISANGLSSTDIGPASLVDELPVGRFARHDGFVVATKELDPDPERVWRDLRDKIRNCVRKAWRHGLEPDEGSLAEFYDVLAENMHQKGTPIYGDAFLRAILEAFGRQARVLTLRHRGRTISGALLIEWRGTLYVPFASSRPDALSMNPNNLLYWEIIRQGCLGGLKTLDFGRSAAGSGGLGFKTGWGAKVAAQPSYVRTRAADGKPRLDGDDPLAALFIRGWRRLPRSVADRLGPVICRLWAA